MKFSIIAAVDSKMGIGKNSRLPWHLPSDMKFFHNTTTGSGKNAVIMGRLTWESIPGNRRPLKDRLNIVVTRNARYQVPAGTQIAESLEKALNVAAQNNAEGIFVIGGAQIFYDAIAHSSCSGLFITEVEGDFGCDVFFPKIDQEKFKKISASEEKEENGIRFRFVKYA